MHNYAFFDFQTYSNAFYHSLAFISYLMYPSTSFGSRDISPPKRSSRVESRESWDIYIVKYGGGGGGGGGGAAAGVSPVALPGH